MITVAYVIYGLKYGGAEKLLKPLSSGLNKDKFRAIVLALTCGGPVEQELRGAGVDVRVLRRDGRFSIFDLGRLVKLLKEENVDIVHTHLQNADIWAGFAARLCGIKHVSTLHGAYFKKSPFEFIKQRLRVAFPWRIIAVSRQTAEYSIARLKARREKVSVIYNAIDASEFQVVHDAVLKRRELGISDGAIVLGVFGRLEAEKGHRYLIEAVSHLRGSCPDINLEVLIVGEGNLKEELIRMVSRLKLEKVIRFLGERSDVPELLDVVSIVVIPSLSEGFPISCLEAMAAGKPIAATNVGGVSELIKDRVDGILVQPKDYLGLARAILDIMDNQELALSLSKHARDKVSSDFTFERMIAQTVAVYESLLMCSG